MSAGAAENSFRGTLTMALPSKARPGLKRTRASPGTKSGRRRLRFVVCAGVRVACERDGRKVVAARIVRIRKAKIVAFPPKTRSRWPLNCNWGCVTFRRTLNADLSQAFLGFKKYT